MALENSLVSRFQQALDACDRALGHADTPAGGPRVSFSVPLCAAAARTAPPAPAPPAAEAVAPAATPSFQPAAACPPWLKHGGIALLVVGLAVAAYWLHTRVLRDWTSQASAKGTEDEEGDVADRATRSLKRRTTSALASRTTAQRRPRVVPTFAAPRVRFAGMPQIPEQPEATAAGAEETSTDPNFTSI
jgi:hypothetical protein